jgi:hypothetical protein
VTNFGEISNVPLRLLPNIRNFNILAGCQNLKCWIRQGS